MFSLCASCDGHLPIYGSVIVWSLGRVCIETAALFALRLVLGMAIERVLLLDRAVFLLEELPESRVELVPLFAPRLSPRNMAVVCEKHPAPAGLLAAAATPQTP